MRTATHVLLTIALTTVALGCNLFNREEAQPLTADAFVAQRVDGRTDPEPIDRPGQVIVDGVKPPEEGESALARRGGASRAPITEISPAVRDSVRTPDEPRRATTRPAAAKPKSGATAAARTKPDPSGQYVIFGGVLSKVNSRPIYAHKVLAVLDNALAAEAQRYDDEIRFRPVAAKLIAKEIQNQQREELVFAVAEKSLDAREKEVAQFLTTKWQNEEETKAGGSPELARRRWEEEGWDYDERLEYQYRVSMTQLFLQRHVWPMVHVTAEEMRRFYEANKDTLFTQPARAKFRVIKIDPKTLKLTGGADEARQIARDVRAKAVKGENFEALARKTNDPVLKATGGQISTEDEGWLPKGSYVAEKVEAAVWALKPGQVTNVIEEKGAYYVAKLEDRHEPKTQDFEDFEVQQAIDRRLRGQQFRELHDRFQNKLIADAVVEENPKMLQVALDMAMQRYPAWRGEGEK